MAFPRNKKNKLIMQYHEIKRDHQDSILFYQIGDFYEIWAGDAMKAAKILNLTIMLRNKKQKLKPTKILPIRADCTRFVPQTNTAVKNKYHNIPTCGFPIHTAANRIAQLSRAGEKIAVCDEIRTDTGELIQRRVVRLVTSWTPQKRNPDSASITK